MPPPSVCVSWFFHLSGCSCCWLFSPFVSSPSRRVASSFSAINIHRWTRKKGNTTSHDWHSCETAHGSACAALYVMEIVINLLASMVERRGKELNEIKMLKRDRLRLHALTFVFAKCFPLHMKMPMHDEKRFSTVMLISQLCAREGAMITRPATRVSRVVDRTNSSGETWLIRSRSVEKEVGDYVWCELMAFISSLCYWMKLRPVLYFREWKTSVRWEGERRLMTFSDDFFSTRLGLNNSDMGFLSISLRNNLSNLIENRLHRESSPSPEDIVKTLFLKPLTSKSNNRVS